MIGSQPQEPLDYAEVRIPPPVLPVVAVLLGVALDWVWDLGFSGGSSLSIALGAAATCGGVAILLSAFSVFRRIHQHPDPRKPTPAITRDGPYRFTRNPMYLAIALLQLGVGLVLDNAWILLLLVPVLLIIHYDAILPEERYLEQKFGEEYTRFKSSVRRWI
jgi:protein-S-isoprenylcysteine O-methyltransferase Ste14